MATVVKYNAKKRTYTGTKENDVLDASIWGYEPIGKINIKKNRGLTITGGNGDDKITGTDYNDTIKGGNGNDTISGGFGVDTITGGAGVNVINYSKGDGNDIINLTKGENFTLNFTDLTKDDLRFEFANKNKDLRIYTSKTSDDEYITIKNFVKKDVTNNSNNRKGISDTSSVELMFNNAESSRIDLRTATDLYKTEIVKNYTGTWLSETISAEDYTLYETYKDPDTGEKERIESDNYAKKGLTIKTGNGNNTVTGSYYSDTIICGNGDDTIYIIGGNDKIAGGKGKNTFIFDSYKYHEGTSTITDAKSDDIIKFEDINSEDLHFVQNGNNLEIFFDTSYTGYLDTFYKDLLSDKIVIQNYFKSKDKIDRIIAKDKELFISDMDIMIVGNGTIKGTDESETIVSFGKQHAKIYSGKGNDNIFLGAKNNTIYFHEGDGNDIVNFVMEYEWDDSNYTLVFPKESDLRMVPVLKFYESATGFSVSKPYKIIYGESDSVILWYRGHDFGDNVKIKQGNEIDDIEDCFYIQSHPIISVKEDNETVSGNASGNEIVINGNNNTIYARDGKDYIYG